MSFGIINIAYLSINGKCNRSVFPVSNGLTILRGGGVGVLTIGNDEKVPFRRFRMDVGVWNSRDTATCVVELTIVPLLKFVIVVLA